jgi:plastocyanin
VRIAAVAFLAIVAASWTAAADHPDGTESFLVRILSTFDPVHDFEPKVGDTSLALVTFRNDDRFHHDLRWTADLGVIGATWPGEHVTVPSPPPGRHPYFCVEHAWMHGVLVVES